MRAGRARAERARAVDARGRWVQGRVVEVAPHYHQEAAPHHHELVTADALGERVGLRTVCTTEDMPPTTTHVSYLWPPRNLNLPASSYVELTSLAMDGLSAPGTATGNSRAQKSGSPPQTVPRP
ncbi:MAG: hypothetical protein KatS3mg111_4085 [Pirellulaceae bacterium]|nr:MAG: hypothetical protein KatS3mg111_4085 [Pirellulaceae bacterium]